MNDMAKKKPKPDAVEEKAPQTPFRPDDKRLMDAIDAFAHETRRSRNMAMVILIEDALKALGRWPPPPKKAPS